MLKQAKPNFGGFRIQTETRSYTFGLIGLESQTEIYIKNEFEVIYQAQSKVTFVVLDILKRLTKANLYK